MTSKRQLVEVEALTSRYDGRLDPRFLIEARREGPASCTDRLSKTVSMPKQVVHHLKW